MRHKMTKPVFLALVVALLLTFTACGGEQQNSGSGDSPFTAMETTDLEGNTVTGEMFAQNTLTMVNVWNVGCTPCVNEIPVLDQLNRDYADKGVAVTELYYNLGAEFTEETKSEIQNILDDAKATYPHLLISDDMAKSETIGEITAFPTTFFVDAKGNIINVTVGANDYEGWQAIIDEMLKKAEGNE